jgi:hypothetical protein
MFEALYPCLTKAILLSNLPQSYNTTIGDCDSCQASTLDFFLDTTFFLSPGQKFTMRLLDVGNRDLYGKL